MVPARWLVGPGGRQLPPKMQRLRREGGRLIRTERAIRSQGTQDVGLIALSAGRVLIRVIGRGIHRRRRKYRYLRP
jgi:hypothetical protein